MKSNIITGFNRQQGAFSVMSAAVIMLSLGFLVLAVDTGRLYMEQRHIQRLADTAALESITRLERGDCSASPDSAQLYAEENSRASGFLSNERQSVETRCVNISTINGIRTAIPQANGRAIEVAVGNQVPASMVVRAGSLFNSNLSDSIKLQAIAVAEKEEPAAVFTVGAQLLRLGNDKLLGNLLKTVGLNINNLTVLDSQGLADTTITPSGLLSALGVDVGIGQLKALSPQGLVDLVNTEVGLLGLDELVDLSLEVVSDSVLKAELGLLRQEILKNPILKDIGLNLFGAPGTPGLLSLASTSEGDVGAALDAQVNLGDLLKTGLMIGASGRAVHIPELNVLGLAKVQAGVVEPPSIGIGPVGTQAYNAQVRLYIGVDTNELLGGVLAWLTDTILGTRINLPIWIDVVSGHGTLESIDCSVSPPQATIAVESDILNACVGKMPDSLKWSGSQSCEYSLQEDELIRLLHIPVLSGKAHIQALEHNEDVTLAVGDDPVSTSPNAIALGDTVERLVYSLLDLLSGLFRKPVSNFGDDLNYTDAARNQLIDKLADQYLEATKVSGLYNVDNVLKLVLDGGNEFDSEGNKILPPLVESDWVIKNSIPKSCFLVACPVSTWSDGTFSQAFRAYTSTPYSVLDIVGIPTLANGHQACAGLINSLLNWNGCVSSNLKKFLKDNADAVSLSQNADAGSILNTGSNVVSCSGTICLLLKPVLQLLKPILNGVGRLLDVVLADVLGLELGRTDVHLQSVSCGIPRLVR